MRALTSQETERFEALTSGKYDNFALVSSEFMGEPVAVIASVTREEDGQYKVLALYVAVNDAIFARLTDPATELDPEAAQ